MAVLLLVPLLVLLLLVAAAGAAAGWGAAWWLVPALCRSCQSGPNPQSVSHSCPAPAPAPQGKEGVKGRYWFTEGDLKAGSAIKMDKSGKAVLMVMRHLGRVQELRCSVQGAQLTVYVLNSPGV